MALRADRGGWVVWRLAASVAGEANLRWDAPPAMASEDFGFIMRAVPGAHVLLGNGGSASVRNHLYDFNDEAIPYGVALYAAITVKKLLKGAPD